MRARSRGMLLVAVGGIMVICVANLGCRTPDTKIAAGGGPNAGAMDTLESGFLPPSNKPGASSAAGSINKTSYQPDNGVAGARSPDQTPPRSLPEPGKKFEASGDVVPACARRMGEGQYRQRELPTELVMVSHAPYVIEPPDVLLVDAIRFIPRPPFRVEPMDVLMIQAAESLPNQPIANAYAVSPDGTVNLGFVYGSVRVAGLTLEQAEAAIRTQLATKLKNPQVSVALAQSRALQLTRGEHLVRQDGTISLGTYGCVYVAGLTTMQAKRVIEEYLGQFLLNPEVSVDVLSYNSKAYYVITDGAGYGMSVFRFPITGKETVLDAISQTGGLSFVASKKKIWVARPAPPNMPCNQIMPVDWMAVTMGASTATNYQLFPGDRVYIMADPWICFDNWLGKILSPVERMLGITILTEATVHGFRSNNNNNGGF